MDAQSKPRRNVIVDKLEVTKDGQLLDDIFIGRKTMKSGFVLDILKSVSMRKPCKTRQEVMQLKSPTSFKLGTNVE